MCDGQVQGNRMNKVPTSSKAAMGLGTPFEHNLLQALPAVPNMPEDGGKTGRTHATSVQKGCRRGVPEQISCCSIN